MKFSGVLMVDVVRDVVLQSLHVEVDSLEKGRKAGRWNTKAYKTTFIIIQSQII